MSAQAAGALTPSPSEMAAARAWTAAHLASDQAHRQPAFSFAYGGKPVTRRLGGWRLQRASRRLDAARTEHTLAYADPQTGLQVRVEAVEYRDLPAVEWLVQLHNGGSADTPIIEQIQPLDLLLPLGAGEDCTLHYSLGDSNSADSFAPVSKPLPLRAHVALAPNGGRSSDGYLPFCSLQRGQGGLVVAIGWTGQWQAQFSRLGSGALRVRAGMEHTHLRLHPGETIRTPRLLLLFWRGEDDLRGNNLFRRLLLAHYLPRQDGQPVWPPICGSVSEVDPDGSYEGPHLRIMPILARLGMEVFWSDMDPQQWYPGGFPTGTGTWEPDPAKYPRGLAPIGQAAHQAGLGYLLWFEPERVHPGTRIDREHPEWVLRPQGEWSQLFALHQEAARAWLTDHIDAQVSAAGLDWVRWDFNIEPLGFWRRQDAPDREGMTEIRYVEGLYAMWDELRARHPGLVVDLCASGGRRIDLESLRRGLPLWHSDLQCSGAHPAADQLQNGGLGRWLPLHGCGNFGLEPSYQFRSALTAGNILCSNLADPASEAAARRTVERYRELRPYFLGDFYPLLPHRAAEDAWYGYQLHRPDLQAGFALLFRREQSGREAETIRLAGLEAGARYQVTQEHAPQPVLVSGNAPTVTVRIPVAPGSAIVRYQRAR